MLWIILITLLALCAAYVIGGWIDRAAARRNAEWEAQSHKATLRGTAQFAASCIGRMTQETLLARHAAAAAGRILMQCMLEESKEELHGDEWEELCCMMEIALAHDEHAQDFSSDPAQKT